MEKHPEDLKESNKTSRPRMIVERMQDVRKSGRSGQYCSPSLDS